MVRWIALLLLFWVVHISNRGPLKPAKLQPGPSSPPGPPHSPGLGGVCPFISALKPGQGRWNSALDSSGDALSGNQHGPRLVAMPAKLPPGPSSPPGTTISRFLLFFIYLKRIYTGVYQVERKRIFSRTPRQFSSSRYR